jgi:SagB-type dehydrogenase family enzyme
VTGHLQVGLPASSACDRISVDLILASGIVVADFGIARQVLRQRPLELAPDTAWGLTPGASCHFKGDQVTVAFDLLPDNVSSRNGQVAVTRTRRTVNVEFEEAALSVLFDGLSPGRTLGELIGLLPQPARAPALDIVADLIGWEAVIDGSGSRSRLAHEWSMRGARARGRLAPEEVAALTFTPTQRGNQVSAIDLAAPGQFPVDSLTEVLRRRRSPAHYDSSPITVDQLGQLLGAACGITGELVLADRLLPLRAYPSPGALYAVDISIVPKRVDGLPCGVFRYDPERHALVAVHDQHVDPVSFCLPDVRGVVDGVAAFVALSVFLSRATQKYGDESYRILVAEAGCIAENLILAAHGLGLRAGPFTGVFDRLVDQATGLDRNGGRFVVGVLVGHAGSTS